MSTETRSDRGMVLPIVLVVAVVLSVVVVTLASYATAGLRYGQVVEDRADRLAAADGGMRYAIEKLRLNQSDCTTNEGSGSGSMTVFPPTINTANTTVTCQRVGAGAGDTQGWSVIITGGASGTGILKTQGGNDKTFGGPVFIYNPNRIDLSGGQLTLENGDLWYTSGNCASSTFTGVSGLSFSPAFLRGPVCTPSSWTDFFTAPAVNVPTNTPAPPVTSGGCTVFSPGKYTNGNKPSLGSFNYFKAGEYYFENFDFVIDHARVIAGFSDGRYGDTQALTNGPCASAQSGDASSGALPGATFYLGGTATIDVDTQGEFEIMRRQQGDRRVSIQALDTSGTGYTASTIGLSPRPIVDVKAGDPQDLAMHGHVWAPRAWARFNNVANRARGQVLGGITIGSIEAQSSNGDGLLVRVETDPADSRLLLQATAIKPGNPAATTIRAVIQVQPDSDYLAINSWRVVE